MIKALLTIRLKQLYRSLVGIGLFRLIFLLGLVAILGVILYYQATDATISLFIGIGLLILIAVIQIKRGDKLFLKSHFSNYKILIFAEYLAISSPVMLLMVVHKQWFSLICFLGLFLIVHLDIKAKHSSVNTKLQALIPSDSFEWKAGLRKQLFILVPIWIIGAATSFFIASVPIAIFILGIAVSSFYEKGEPYQMILFQELSAKKFLFLKVKRQIQMFSIATVPLVLLFIAFNFELWYIPAAEYLFFCFLHVYVIMTKYAFYEPNEKSRSAQTMASLGMVGTIIPVFLPVVMLMSVWFYGKSINNLNYYLHDYN